MTAPARPLVALLMAGGGGTRLWPLSTEAEPKQFMPLFGERTLFARTLARAAAAGIGEIVVTTNVRYERRVREQMADFSGSVRIIVEPERRESGPAVAAGVAAILAEHPGATVVVAMPCDHLIADGPDFRAALTEAMAVADAGRLVTFGIQPEGPSTEYGYIQRGTALPAGGFDVAKFHEKPDAATARVYAADGRYLWNSGIFVFRADRFAAEARRHMAEMWEAASAAVEHGERCEGRLLLDAPAFARARRLSIDRALFEHSDQVAVVPATFAWSDVGNWRSVHAALDKDSDGNAVLGEATVSDGAGNLVIGSGVRVAAAGLNGFAVVASPAGTLVAPLARASAIKRVVDR